MITLYGSGQSRSFRALWALEESGLPFEYMHTRIGHPDPEGSQHPSYLKLNAQGKVPTLIDDSLQLTESAAIMNYIAALVPDQQLIPNQSIAQRAKYDEFSYFVLTDLEQPLWTKGKHSFVLPENQRVSDVLETAKWEFKRSLKALDQFVEGKDFVFNDRFSFADILLAHTFNWADRFEFELADHHIAYRDRLYQRPACLKALDKTKP